MKPSQIISYVRSQLGEPAVSVFTPSETIYGFLKYSLKIISERVPPIYDCSVPYSSGIYYVEIPNSYRVISVYNVTPVKIEGSNNNDIIFDFYPSIFGMGVDAKTSFSNIQNFIQDRANILTLLEMTGKNFGWTTSEQNKNKIYVNDIPPSTSAFYIKFAAELPALAENYSDISLTDTDLPQSQIPLILQFVEANTRMTEGRILRRVSGGSQASANDGEALVSEGIAMLESFKSEIFKQTYLS